MIAAAVTSLSEANAALADATACPAACPVTARKHNFTPVIQQTARNFLCVIAQPDVQGKARAMRQTCDSGAEKI